MRVKSFLKQRFDRLRPQIQKNIASAYYRTLGKGNRRISYSGGMFEHRFRNARVFSPSAILKSPPEMDELTLDIYCWAYRPQPGDIVIDVGAGFGSEALTFSGLVGEKGKVICVEAHPLVSSCLSKTVSENGLTNTRVETVALLESAGVVSMGDSTTSWFGNSIVSQGEEQGKEIVEVEGISFADLLERHSLQGSKINFVKMNIEGAEWPVLKGMIASLEKIENLAISCHDFKAQRLGVPEFRTYMYVSDLLKDHGFHVETRADPRPYVADVVYASRMKS